MPHENQFETGKQVVVLNLFPRFKKSCSAQEVQTSHLAGNQSYFTRK